MGEENKEYDLIIIGSGPAGLTAGIYAVRYKLKTLIIGLSNGGLLSEAHKVCNFPSEKEISGFDLGQKIAENALSQGVEIINTEATDIKKNSDIFTVKTIDGKVFNSKAVLLATGTKRRELKLEDESKFLGHGLSYCATCDGAFFKDKIVAVVGGGNSALTSALYLADVAKRVFLIYRGEELKGEPILAEKIKQTENIEILLKTKLVAYLGNDELEAIKLDQPYQNSDTISLNGVFLEIGSEPREDSYLGEMAIKQNEGGRIEVDSAQKTSTAGVWAAGDITNGSNNFLQIITACSEGAIAAADIFKTIKLKK